MKKLITLALIAVSFNAFAVPWRLVNSQLIGGKWYCTYQYGTMQTTIVTQSYCAGFIDL